MSPSILQVDGERIVDSEGRTVILRGAGLGGWMNMENFVTGYPGHESKHRTAMLEVLGKEKYEFFFDKWLEYFFTERDAEFVASLGLNCLRLPFNHRHLEDDMNPRILREEGFKHIDRVINLCAKYNIYTVLDMHTVPGGQNTDWHSDNSSTTAGFWDYKDHQDRTVWLWSEIAKKYKENAWVAGFNPINEPCDSEHYRLPEFYICLENAIRKVDSKHILFLDGNTFAMEWKFFEPLISGTTKLSNCVYCIHDYSTMGLPSGEPFEGTVEQISKLESTFLRKAELMHKYKVPIWNGEFGPVYADPNHSTDYVAINNQRYNLVGEQMKLYDKYEISWSIWLYKDIGIQGMVYTSPKSKWTKTIESFLRKKEMYQLDGWGTPPSTELSNIINPLIDWIDKVSPEAKNTYPKNWGVKRHILRSVIQIFVSESLQMEFAKPFDGMSMDDLEECVKSFSYDKCVKREGLNQIMRDHAKLSK